MELPVDVSLAFITLQENSDLEWLFTEVANFYQRSDVIAAVATIPTRHPIFDATIQAHNTAIENPAVTAGLYLDQLIQWVLEPIAVPYTGDPSLDPLIKDFNEFLTSERAASAGLALAVFFTRDEVRQYVANKVDKASGNGTLYVEDLFVGSVAKLANIRIVIPIGLGSIIAAVVTIAGGVAIGVCLLVAPCGATGAALIGAGAAIIAGTAALIDAVTQDTVSRGACAIKAASSADYPRRVFFAASSVKCPNTQTRIGLDNGFTKNGTYAGGTFGSCTGCRSYSLGSSTTAPSGIPCYQTDARYTASPGLPTSGQDYSGIICFF